MTNPMKKIVHKFYVNIAMRSPEYWTPCRKATVNSIGVKDWKDVTCKSCLNSKDFKNRD